LENIYNAVNIFHQAWKIFTMHLGHISLGLENIIHDLGHISLGLENIIHDLGNISPGLEDIYNAVNIFH
jgi:hypothetical protein